MKNKYVTLHLIFAFLAILIAFALPWQIFFPNQNMFEEYELLAFHIVKYSFSLVAFHHFFQAAKIHLDEKENQTKE